MADLVEIGFKIKLDGLEQANTLVGGLLTKVESLEKGMQDVPAATAKAASGLKSVGKAATETGDSLSAAEKKLKQAQDTAEYMAQGLTRSMASTMTSMKQLEGGEAILKDFKAALEQIYKLSGNKNPFDSVAGALTRVNTGLKEAIETQKALQSGMRITSQQAKDLIDIQARGDALKLDAGAIDAQKQAYLQESALLNTITAQNKTITDEQDRQLKSSKEQLRIQQNFNAEIEKTKRINALKSEGFNTSQANKIIGFEDAGVSDAQINDWKKLNLVTNQAKVSTEQYGDAAVVAFRKSQKEAATINSQLQKTKISIDAVKAGFSKTSASSIANFSMQSGVTPAQVEEFKNLRMEMDRVDVASRRTTSGFTKMSEVARQLIPSIGAIGLAGAIAASIREVIRLADAANLIVARINLVKGAAENTTAIFGDLVRISKANRVELTTTATLYTRLVPALQDIGKGTKEALRVTEAFGAALVISGANTQEMIAATTQFSQAMASGRLAGDEFRSISEASPAFLKAIAEGAGVARSELKKMSQDQLLTTEFLTNALDNQFDKLTGKVKGLPVTVGQAFQNMLTDVTLFAKELNESSGLITGITGLIAQLGSGIKAMSGVFSALGATLSVVLPVAVDLFTAFLAYKSISKIIIGVEAAFLLVGRAIAATQVSAALLNTTLSIGPLGAIAGVATALAAAFVYLQREQDKFTEQNTKIADSNTNLVKSFQSNTKSVDEARKKYKELSDEFPELAKAQKEMFEKNGLSEESKRELEDAATFLKGLKAEFATLTDKRDAIGGGFLTKTEKQRIFDIQRQIALAEENNLVLKEKLTIEEAIDAINGNSKYGNETLTTLKSEVVELEKILGLKQQGLSLDNTKILLEAVTAAKDKAPLMLRQAAENSALEQGIALIKRKTALEKEVEKQFPKDKKDKAQKDPIVEQILNYEKLFAAYTKVGDLDKARLISQGATLEQAGKILAFQEREASIKSAITYKDDVKYLQMFLSELEGGLAVKEADLAVEKEKLKVKMASEGRTPDEIKRYMELIEQKEKAVKLEKESEEVAKRTADFLKVDKFEIGDIFGDAGKSAAALINAFQSINKQQEDYNKLRKENIDLGKDTGAIDKKNSRDNLKNTALVLNATKGFFKEKSAGYKIIDGLEKAMFALQIANQAQELAAFLTSVPVKIAGFLGIGTAAGAAAVASAAIQPGPLAFVGAAAMIALLASVGLNIGGGGKGGGGVVPANEGKGTVLGDSDATSKSIKNAIETLADNSRVELPITSEMLKSLRNIEGGIKGVGNLIARAATTGNAPAQKSAASSTGSYNGSSADVVNGLLQLAGFAKTISAFTTVLAGANGFFSTANAAFAVFNTLGGASAAGTAVGGGLGALSGSGTAGLLGTGAIGLGVALVSALVPAVGEAFNKVIEKSIPVLNTLTFGLSDALIFKPLGKLFGSVFGKTKVSVTGQGLFGADQSLGDILTEGFDLQEYVDLKVKKKRLTGSKTSYRTQFSDTVDKQFEDQFTQIFANFARSIAIAGVSLGRDLEQVGNNISSFVVKIGKIDLKGLKPEEISEKLEAIFGQQADLLAQAALAGLDEFQQVGEGYFETIVRVASGVERARYSADRFRVSLISYNDVINKQGDIQVELLRQSLIAFEQSTYGFTTGVVQIVDSFDGSIDELDDMYNALLGMRQQLDAAGKSVQDLSVNMVKGAGSFEALGEGLSSYFEDFLTAEEQAQSMTKQLTSEFSRLNLSLPESKDAFKELIRSIDTSTVAGQELFGAVIALSPAFAELQDKLEDIGGVGTPNLLAKFLSLEERFDALGVKMPNTSAEFDALVDKLILSGNSIVDLSQEFDILTGANQRLASSNLDVASKTNSLNDKFAALGLQLPQNRIEFDNLILTLRGASGSSNDMSLAVESLSDEFNLLSIATKQQEAAALAAGYAYDNLQNATGSSVTGTNGLASQVRALSDDFYSFQIQLAEFGGEAGKAIASLFESLYKVRGSVESNVTSITGSDKIVMTPSAIRAALADIGQLALPSNSIRTDLTSQKLALMQSIGGKQSTIDSLAAQIASKQNAINVEAGKQDTIYNQHVRGVALARSLASSMGLNLRNNSGQAASFSMDRDTGTVSSDYNVLNGRSSSFVPFKDAFYDRGVGATDAQKVDGLSIYDAIYSQSAKYKQSLTAQATLVSQLTDLTTSSNTTTAQKLVLEQQLNDVNAELLVNQDAYRATLQDFALDAERNIKRIDKLREETMRYYEAQKALSTLMETSANKLAATLKSVRDAQLTPLQLLNQMQTEFNAAYARAQVATGAALSTAANELDALISPLLAQAATVYASGSESTNIRDFVLSAGDEIVSRLEDLRPKDYEAESLDILAQIDSTLYTLELAAADANKLLIAAIDLGRVQTVAELANITSVLGGNPVDQSQFIASAMGNAFSGGNVMAFANGGAFTNSIVNSPTMFPLGLMGEAGPEAIMPLARGSNGSLGVRIVGGGSNNSGIEQKLDEANSHSAALVRVQQEGNQKIIAKLSKMEERLDGLESAARLEAAS